MFFLSRNMESEWPKQSIYTDVLSSDTSTAEGPDLSDCALQGGWKDDEFPHNNDSVGAKAASKCKYSRWLRALSLHPAPALFADVEPSDACQGTVGNCWLVAAA